MNVPDTPLGPGELAAAARELRALLGELAELTGAGDAWSLRVLRRNVEIAWLCPETLETRQNQLDFVEDLAEAVWDGADPGFRQPLWTSGADPEETRAGEQRRQAVVERLDQIAERLCREVEHWQQLAAAAPRDA